MTKKIRELTRAEEEVMQVLWKIESGFVKDMLDYFEDPKPAYNTVSTIVRILEDKGFVAHEAFGKSHQYHPLVSKSEYSRFRLKKLTDGYFDGSYEKLLSFIMEQGDLSIREIEEVRQSAKKNKN